ncbi:MAG TPA: NUDIX domain-containing protein [Galbitalea sp.]
MAPVRSAGILLWRRGDSGLEVFIAHMGGPFWSKKDAAAWSLPKGEFLETEDELAAAKREFLEEIGVASPALEYTRLGEFRQSSGKIVVAFAAESDLEVDRAVSNTFSVEWPPRSGRLQEFPEIDDARWFAVPEARTRLVKGQVPILDALLAHL